MIKKYFYLLFILFLFSKLTYSQVQQAKAEAELIYNFTRFFDWPQKEKTGDFVIGVFGNKNLFDELEVATKNKLNLTQDIVIKYFSSYKSISKCHVIFVSDLNSKHIKDVFLKTGVHCLIISNNNTAIDKGAAIQLFVEDSRLRYNFSEENALKHGLKFHSKISEMADSNF